MRNMKLDRRYYCGGGLRETLDTLKAKNDINGFGASENNCSEKQIL